MARSISVRITGLDSFSRRRGVVGRAVRRAVAAELYGEAEEIMATSKAEYVPVDQGVLRSTGHVQPPVDDGNQITVTLGYGGPAAPYALMQHESLHFKHRVGRAKYLEIPLVQAAGGMARRMAPRIRIRLRGV